MLTKLKRRTVLGEDLVEPDVVVTDAGDRHAVLGERLKLILAPALGAVDLQGVVGRLSRPAGSASRHRTPRQGQFSSLSYGSTSRLQFRPEQSGLLQPCPADLQGYLAHSRPKKIAEIQLICGSAAWLRWTRSTTMSSSPSPSDEQISCRQNPRAMDASERCAPDAVRCRIGSFQLRVRHLRRACSLC